MQMLIVTTAIKCIVSVTVLLLSVAFVLLAIDDFTSDKQI